MIGYNIDTVVAQGEELIDEKVIVEITKDKMFGVISFTPSKNGGKELTVDDVHQRIKEAGITYGISEQTMGQVVQQKRYNYKYIIAQGRKPVQGQNGKLEFLFDKDTNCSLKPKENEDGTVDFKNLDLIQTVQKDQLLVRTIAPVQGEPGTNVLGQEIKPNPVKPARLPKGKNVYTSDDGECLFASIEGQILYQNNMVIISETYVVSESAGIATGNIDFSGNVLIKGNVVSGFVIKAGGNVEVLGFVEEATIIAGGDIVLRYGIQGKDHGKLVAGKNIVAKFIQNSTVEAEGSVYTEAIMHSNVTAGDSVFVEMNKGLIVGGSVQATNLISAKIVGSPMSTATTIQISITPALHVKHKLIEADLNRKKEQLDQIQKNVRFIQTKVAAGMKIPQDRMNRFKEMLEVQIQLRQEIQQLQKEYQQLEETLHDYKAGYIKVRDIVYPGTKVVMGSLIKYVKEDMHYCNLCVEGQDIKVEQYV